MQLMQRWCGPIPVPWYLWIPMKIFIHSTSTTTIHLRKCIDLVIYCLISSRKDVPNQPKSTSYRPSYPEAFLDASCKERGLPSLSFWIAGLTRHYPSLGWCNGTCTGNPSFWPAKIGWFPPDFPSNSANPWLKRIPQLAQGPLEILRDARFKGWNLL